jgi:methylthioribose-1-phosphate isomerase
VTLLADGAAAALMREGRVRWAIVGADRIAANGDVANKIGTYHLAVAARYHGVRFMVVAPASTVDMNLISGAAIPIEQRAPEELLTLAGQSVAAVGAEGMESVVRCDPGRTGGCAGDRTGCGASTRCPATGATDGQQRFGMNRGQSGIAPENSR